LRWTNDISGVRVSFAPPGLSPRIASVPTACDVGYILFAASRLAAKGVKTG
jgi:hypothetical protein